MSPIAAGLIVVALAYLAGSLPFGLLTAKLARGIDIRQHGSGNIGATNVARVIGARYGALVLLLDGLKGMLPVLLLPQLFEVLREESGSTGEHVRVGLGIAAILGHMFPCWLRLQGGKGVATGLGVVLVLSWQATLAALSVFLLVVATVRIVSLASMLGSTAFCAAHLLLHPEPFSRQAWSLTAFSVAVPILIIARHHSNLRRLLKGQEPRFHLGAGKDAKRVPED